MSAPPTPEERKARVRAILAYPATVSTRTIVEATGHARETVRRVRFGLKDADVLPDLPRLVPGIGNAFCHQCVQWESSNDPNRNRSGRCMLGIPEAILEGRRWARSCGAFLRRS